MKIDTFFSIIRIKNWMKNNSLNIIPVLQSWPCFALSKYSWHSNFQKSELKHHKQGWDWGRNDRIQLLYRVALVLKYLSSIRPRVPRCEKECQKCVIYRSIYLLGNMGLALFAHMMTSSNGTFSALLAICAGKSPDRWIPRTKASDAELWCFLWSASE